MQYINNNFRRESCPFCHAKDIEKIGDIDYGMPVLFSSSEIKLLKTAELWKCDRCFSGFTQNSIQLKDVIELYTHGQSALRWANVAFEDLKSPHVVRVMKSIFCSAGLVVDVGCNTGELLDFAKALGCKTMGVELSAESQEVLSQKGHEVFTSLEAIKDQSIDVITGFDLIEHLHEVKNFLSLCKKKLKVGGKLILLTGNIECFSSRLASSDWWYCRYPEHIAFPSRHFFSHRSGFNLLEAIPTYSSIGYQVNLIHAVLGGLVRVVLGKYRGLPSIGSDHYLYILQK